MQNKYFLTVCLNPVLQKTILLKRLWENEVNRSDEYYLQSSGKGINVSRVLKQIGEETIHLTQLGGQNKDLLLSMTEKENIKINWVDSNSEIRFCYTLINKEKKTITEIVEEANPVGAGTEKSIYKEFLILAESCHTLIISGTKASGFSPDIYPMMVSDAKRLGKKIILDIKCNDLKNCLKYKPDIIKPNLSEFIDTFFTDFSLKENEHKDDVLNLVKDKMIEIFRQYGSISVLTRGKFGTVYLDNDKVKSFPAKNISPVNTTGCGDAYNAGFASAWFKTGNIEQSVIKGTECAAKNAVLIHQGIL
jgi:1-phosphofructokinase family hexose kinase